MPSPEELDPYDEWASHHANLFGLSADQDAAMLVEWVEMFRAGGVSPVELMDATDWLAYNDPPRWRTEHLHLLQKRIRDKRAADQRKLIDEPMPGELGTCSLCGGSGMVSVPHPKAVLRGLWATCAVICSCPMGRWVADRQRGTQHNGDPRPPMLTLGQYELIVPDWRKRLADHEAAQVQEVGATHRARHLDKLMGELQRKWPSKREPGFIRPNPDVPS